MKLGLSALYLTVAVTLLGALPLYVKAATPDSITVTMSPENPSPGENVNISLSSYTYNLDSVLISWSVDGKAGASGIGKKTFSLNAPAAGSAANVSAKINLPDGAVEEKAVVRPSVMVMLWQADDSYVPPFYKGKALPTLDSEIKVVAMPEIKISGSMASPQNMLYAWQQDYNNQPDASGYGKNFFTYNTDYLENASAISVTASTADQKYSSDGNITVGTTSPQILFYKNDPSLGTLWNMALADGHKITGNEIIQAAPYFISPADIRIPTLNWNWSINDSSVSAPQFNPYLLPVQAQSGVSGTSKINLQINSIDKIFESASGQINVQF